MAVDVDEVTPSRTWDAVSVALWQTSADGTDLRGEFCLRAQAGGRLPDLPERVSLEVPVVILEWALRARDQQGPGTFLFCAGCGRGFVPVRHGQRYCTTRCNARERQRRFRQRSR